jgi:hypothetical protein
MLAKRLAWILPLTVAVTLAACTPTPSSPSAAPRPQEYTCAFQGRMLAELQSLPPTAALWIATDDYRVQRAQLRALHRLPEPKACP